MQEVLKKIDTLHSLLEKKVRQADDTLARLAERKAEIEKIEERQKATANAQSAQERVFAKRKPIDDELAEIKKTRKKLSTDKADLVDRLSLIEKKEKSINADSAELQKMKEVFKKKNEKLDELEKQLKIEKKLMKEKVLEEIKGQL